jgi:non-specific serine/threonine protein kinase
MAEPTPTDSRSQSVPLAPQAYSDRRDAPLPTPLTSFVGREREVADLAALLRRDDVRLVTLTGPGGVGKTRLALRAAQAVVGELADGARFIDFSPLADPALVLPTIAKALGLRESGDRPLAEQLAAWFAARELLLVLDNLEQVIEAAPQVAVLLASCPSLTVLATSRVVLRLAAEHVFPIEPLMVPDPARPLPPADLAAVEAVALFMQRARAAEPGFALTDANAPTVAAIVRHVEGLPLAVELAAARIRQLPPAALLGQLTERLRVLTGGPRDAPARQRTLRDATSWSYDLLAPAEQALFRRIAVFAGGCTPAVAAAVADPEGDLGIDVLDGLFALVDHSLLRRVDTARAVVPGGNEPRFRMLESVRDFALERLAACGETDAVRARHAGVVAEVAERAAPPWKPPSALAFARLAAEHDNARAALAWAIERGEAELGLRVAATYHRLWQIHGHLAEGQRWLGQVLALDGPAPPSLRVAALVGVGRLQGDCEDAAEAAYREALAIALSLPPGPELPVVMFHLGNVALSCGDLGGAETWYRRALERARVAAEDWGFLGLTGLGTVAEDKGDVARAVALYEEAAAICRRAGVPWALSGQLGRLSDLARRQGDRQRAAPLDRERLAIRRNLESGELVGDCCLVAAEAAVWLRQPERAARLLGAGIALIEEVDDGLPPHLQASMETLEAALRTALSDEAFAAAFNAGGGLPLEEAATEADAVFAEEATAAAAAPVPAPPVPSSHGLSLREIEVVRLLAAGRSNREIAEALFISHGTAATHVRNILTKLDLDSRTAVAAWAIRSGLA